jgi:hypothetical protein
MASTDKPEGWLSLLWHIPGRAWAGAMKAAPLRTWLTAGAGMAWTVMSGWLVWFLNDKLRGGDAFWIIESALLLVAAGIVALAGVEIALRGGKDGVSLNIGQDKPDGAP